MVSGPLPADEVRGHGGANASDRRAVIDYDAELQLHDEQLRAAYGIQTADRVLDIGCGTGQTTREAARLAPDGEAFGLDIDREMVAHA